MFIENSKQICVSFQVMRRRCGRPVVGGSARLERRLPTVNARPWLRSVLNATVHRILSQPRLHPLEMAASWSSRRWKHSGSSQPDLREDIDYPFSEPNALA